MPVMPLMAVFVTPPVSAVVKNTFTFLVGPDPVTVGTPGAALLAAVNNTAIQAESSILPGCYCPVCGSIIHQGVLMACSFSSPFSG